jgi:hypothetical protein
MSHYNNLCRGVYGKVITNIPQRIGGLLISKVDVVDDLIGSGGVAGVDRNQAKREQGDEAKYKKFAHE